jgi:PPOX class probable F420-dependent enzyme
VLAADARDRCAAARVARLATASADASPHVVPITFALVDDTTLVTAVDHKPKRTTALRRLANIAANPAVAVLVDDYSEDWDALWWARADGRAHVIDAGDDPPTRDRALSALSDRYEQYRTRQPDGPIIVIAVERWSGWSAGDALRERSPSA